MGFLGASLDIIAGEEFMGKFLARNGRKGKGIKGGDKRRRKNGTVPSLHYDSAVALWGRGEKKDEDHILCKSLLRRRGMGPLRCFCSSFFYPHLME